MRFRQRIKAGIKAFSFAGTSILNFFFAFGGTENVRGNRFRSYGQQVAELIRKYNGYADYGCQVTKACIDYRVAWIVGNGISVKVGSDDEEIDDSLPDSLAPTSIPQDPTEAKSKAQSEPLISGNPKDSKQSAKNPKKPDKFQATKDFIEKFIDDNKLSSSRFRRFATGGELEGKCLLYLVAEGTGTECKILIKHLWWSQHGYEIVADQNDYEVIKEIKNIKDSSGGALEYDQETMQFVILSAITNNPNQTPPRLAAVLTQIDNLDRALGDMRANNHLFAIASPYWKTDTLDTAEEIKLAILDPKQPWKPGHMMAAPAEFSYQEPTGNAQKVLESEIEINAKIISGTSGVAIHYLGYPDLMNNRSTAEDMQEMNNACTSLERQCWAEAFEQIFIKAVRLYNKNGNAIPECGMEVQIPSATIAQLKMLVDVWLPLQEAGIVSKRSIRNRVPDIDPDDEEEQIQEEQGDNMQSQMDQIHEKLNSALAQNNPNATMPGQDQKPAPDPFAKKPEPIPAGVKK